MIDRLMKLCWWLDHEGYHVPTELWDCMVEIATHKVNMAMETNTR